MRFQIKNLIYFFFFFLTFPEINFVRMDSYELDAKNVRVFGSLTDAAAVAA